ncbi:MULTISPECIES: hypothetical protein [Rhizobium]|jgi:hypothetical protein|uniref:hypothetical protein n=1 Tax=Rhizobium indigoferae TaxID=158891 RepID=UPI0024E08894|nr:hypothetical protein [Rhizobium indigoferae]
MSSEDNFLPVVLINTLGIAGIVVWHTGRKPSDRSPDRPGPFLYRRESRAFYGKHRAAPARWYRTPSKIAYEPKALGKK